MKKIYISTVLALIVVASGCNKDYLNKLPKDQLTTSTAFKTYDNFKTYAWGLYDYMWGYGNSSKYPPFFKPEFNADNLCQTVAGDESEYAFQTKIIPAAGGTTSSLVTSQWDFSYVRSVNLMLDNIDKSNMSQEDKDHWRSVGYFFRALRYYDLIAAFGDVPWIEHTLTDTSKSELFAARTPRDEVAHNILADLQWAEQHIGPDQDGPNTINANVIRALISRFGLFEGTWRKYHGLNDAAVYLKACLDASDTLMNAFPTIMDDYDDVFNSEDLVGKPGIILCKQYVAELTTNSLVRYAGSTSWHVDLTQDAVNSYLCADGRPISTSTEYEGDTSMYAEFRNRDRRLYYTVLPPYKVKVGTPYYTWSYTGDTADAEYIKLMQKIGGEGKQLPMMSWSTNMTTGHIINMSPHFKKFNGGQAQAVSELGYFFWKYYNMMQLDSKHNSTNDCPLFRIGEVMLNYAEAAWEMGSFDQAVADRTINKLRVRAHVAPMIVSQIDAGFDPDRDPTVPPVLWEIRRERRVELMGEGFRFNDLKRWKKGEYLNKQKVGVYVNNADFNNKLKIAGGGEKGHVEFFPKPLGWLDKYYLEPVPTQEMALNPNLEQSPGW